MGSDFAVHFSTEVHTSRGKLEETKVYNSSGRIWIPRLMKIVVAVNQLILRYLERPPSGSNSAGRMPASQAGRRGFESRLPLHLFNHFQGHRKIQSPIESTKRQSPSP